MAQLVKELAAKPGDLSLIHKTLMAKGGPVHIGGKRDSQAPAAGVTTMGNVWWRDGKDAKLRSSFTVEKGRTGGLRVGRTGRHEAMVTSWPGLLPRGHVWVLRRTCGYLRAVL